jgi:hypothetical protein
MQICAVHGLRYDSTQHTGCVMCRRGTNDEAVDPVLVERRKALRLGTVGGAAVAIFAAVGLVMALSNRTEPPAAAAPKVASNKEALTAAAPKAPEPPPPPPSMVAIASPAGAKPTMLPRMQIDKAKEQCGAMGEFAGGDYGCLIAITPLLEQLTQIPVSQNASQPAVKAYEMNRTGLGFDCLWFSAPELAQWVDQPKRKGKQRKVAAELPYVALLVASPKDSPAQVSLDANRKPIPAAVQGAPWPVGYQAQLTYDSLATPARGGREAKAKQYSACMTFPNNQPTTVYVGAAAWVGLTPSSMAEEGQTPFAIASVQAMGLSGALETK